MMMKKRIRMVHVAGRAGNSLEGGVETEPIGQFVEMETLTDTGGVIPFAVAVFVAFLA